MGRKLLTIAALIALAPFAGSAHGAEDDGDWRKGPGGGTNIKPGDSFILPVRNKTGTDVIIQLRMVNGDPSEPVRVGWIDDDGEFMCEKYADPGDTLTTDELEFDKDEQRNLKVENIGSPNLARVKWGSRYKKAQ